MTALRVAIFSKNARDRYVPTIAATDGAMLGRRRVVEPFED